MHINILSPECSWWSPCILSTHWTYGLWTFCATVIGWKIQLPFLILEHWPSPNCRSRAAKNFDFFYEGLYVLANHCQFKDSKPCRECSLGWELYSFSEDFSQFSLGVMLPGLLYFLCLAVMHPDRHQEQLRARAGPHRLSKSCCTSSSDEGPRKRTIKVLLGQKPHF